MLYNVILEYIYVLLVSILVMYLLYLLQHLYYIGTDSWSGTLTDIT